MKLSEELIMENPLVGRKVVWIYETVYPGAGFEVEFISNEQLTSKGIGKAEGWSATMPYDMAVVASDIYFVSFNKDDGEVISIVINLTTNKVYASRSTVTPDRVFMTGTVNEQLE
jgi:hypothetical protein